MMVCINTTNSKKRKTYAKNLAPCGCSSNNLEARASPSIKGGGAAAGARRVAALNYYNKR